MSDVATSEQHAISSAAPKAVWGQVIGLPVAVGDLGSMATRIARLARQGGGGSVCVANVHMLVSARRDPALRRVLEDATLVVSDGMPLVWRLRRAGLGAEQVRGPELMVALCGLAEKERIPVYFYGGDDELLRELQASLRQRMPQLPIAGAAVAPALPLRPEVDAATLEAIRRSGACMVFVALGCPKQEFWMAAHRPHLDAVLIGVGQAFGIAAGRLPEAPAWMRRAGLEWLFRLSIEPRRLWRRYLVTNSLFAAYLLQDKIRRGSAGTPASSTR